MAVSKTNLVWLDLEMTGLNPDHDRIMEIATIVTDSELNILAQGPVIAIHQNDELLNNMDAWCTNQHGKSGLTKRCQQSEVSEHQAMAETLAFLEHGSPQAHRLYVGTPLVKTVALVRYMPELDNFFHYRNIDVSTIKELARRWQPEVLDKVEKKGSHLALDDIKDSIMELQVYRTEVFKI